MVDVPEPPVMVAGVNVAVVPAAGWRPRGATFPVKPELGASVTGRR